MGVKFKAYNEKYLFQVALMLVRSKWIDKVLIAQSTNLIDPTGYTLTAIQLEDMIFKHFYNERLMVKLEHDLKMRKQLEASKA